MNALELVCEQHSRDKRKQQRFIHQRVARHFAGTYSDGQSYDMIVRGKIIGTVLDDNGSPLWIMDHCDSDEEHEADREDLDEQELHAAINLEEELVAQERGEG